MGSICKAVNVTSTKYSVVMNQSLPCTWNIQMQWMFCKCNIHCYISMPQYLFLSTVYLDSIKYFGFKECDSQNGKINFVSQRNLYRTGNPESWWSWVTFSSSIKAILGPGLAGQLLHLMKVLISFFLGGWSCESRWFSGTFFIADRR